MRASALNFNGRIDTNERCLSLCCEPVQNRPSTKLEDSAKETIENFVQMRRETIGESKRFAQTSATSERLHTAGCAECANYQSGFWDGDGLIHYINLSMYPAPCQCKCIYCGVHCGESGIFNKSSCTEYYDRMFDALDYAHQVGLIAENATWQISSGEIAIHPYKDRILSLVKNKRAMFYTNCFLFDERIAQNLSVNPYSSINLSIDSGTAHTWQRIKGVDNFDEVIENLVTYFTSSARYGQITLKYIVLPGINDNMEDYLSLMEIMKVLQVKHLTISRDVRQKYGDDSEYKTNVLGATGYLVALLAKNKFTADMFAFAPEERKSVVAFADELLKAGEV